MINIIEDDEYNTDKRKNIFSTASSNILKRISAAAAEDFYFERQRQPPRRYTPPLLPAGGTILAPRSTLCANRVFPTQKSGKYPVRIKLSSYFCIR